MAKAESAKLEDVLRIVTSYDSNANTALIEEAYRFAAHAHRDQKRSSGDPYIVHPTEVARVLAEMRLDLASIITGLLHDTVEDTEATLAEIEEKFGTDVSHLVDGVTKLSKMTFRTTEEKQAENFRKMIIAMAKDIRVILVKLADRLSNMRTLQHLPPHKQQSIAQETLDIYAPIANRLGIGWIKIELEDLCLRYLHSEAYYKIAEKVAKKKKERDQYIENVTEILEEKLKDFEINAQVAGRAKHFYSIYKKIERRNVDFDQIHDLIAFRILVDNITECYKSLGVIHSLYKPVPGRFKDYIAMPKANSYQSLHSTVIGPQGERIEIQIRTQEMHLIAERGIAAHWLYKEGKFGNRTKENIEWVQRLVEWQKDLADPSEFLETVKIDLFAEDVFVFTPKGEVKQLPYGSTPLDFAYAVHTDVGNHCVGAKVNGKIVPLKFRLKSGDTIEIVTSSQQSPSKDWLKIAKSSRAKTKIRAFIKQQERQQAKEIGQELLDKYLRKMSTSVKSIEKSGGLQKLLEAFHFKSADELLVAIGYGKILNEDILTTLFSKEEIEKEKSKTPETDQDQGILTKLFKSVGRRRESSNAIRVANHNDILIRFAKCCHPLPGDSIAGFITRGRGVTIHTARCPKAIDSANERQIDVEWNTTSKSAQKHIVKIRILGYDQPGLLAQMSQSISTQGINISSANVRTTKDKKAICLFEIEVTDITQLNKILQTLESKKGVISVERSS